MEPDWDDLRYFLHAARAGTLARAARELGVEHTTIGRRVSALEQACGGALVLRGPEGLRLTALGERALPLIEQMERSAQALGQLVLTHRTSVRLSVPSGFAMLFAAELKRLEGVSLELSSGVRPLDLHRGEADLALRAGPIADERLVVRKLCDAGFALYAARAYLATHPAPTDLNDLRGHNLIAFDTSMTTLAPAQWLEQRARGASIALRSRELSDMLTAAKSGAGLALLPCVLADPEPELQRLSRQVLVKSRLSLVYLREQRLSPSVRAVARFVTDVIGCHRKRILG
jgi:DNA-binding transcriptional LysR family regulator